MSMLFFIMAIPICIFSNNIKDFYPHLSSFSLMISDVAYLFICLMVIYMTPFEKFLFKSVTHFFFYCQRVHVLTRKRKRERYEWGGAGDGESKREREKASLPVGPGHAAIPSFSFLHPIRIWGHSCIQFSRCVPSVFFKLLEPGVEL